MFHLFFEQSGTFKNELIKLGCQAKDYDILNDFNETDVVIDLFAEIEQAYQEKPSIFNYIIPTDTIIAFFPCVRFEAQIIMNMRGVHSGSKKWDDEKKLEYSMKLQKELSELYGLISKLAIICIKRDIPLIIENPYSTQHYLTRYWPLQPKIIDTNRRRDGDYFMKPTQYWFINCEPENNILFEPIEWVEEKRLKIQEIKSSGV